MAVLSNKSYIRINKNGCYLKSTEIDGIFQVYCSFAIYKTEQDRQIEKLFTEQKTEFVHNVIEHKKNNKDALYIDDLKKFISSFDIDSSVAPQLPEDLELNEIIMDCGYKPEWYTTKYQTAEYTNTMSIATVDLSKQIKIDFNFIYTRLKDYLIGQVEDV